jgi:hypothetical protein
VIRICECAFATDDARRLEAHLMEYGHSERLPWWNTFTQVVLANWLPARIQDSISG